MRDGGKSLNRRQKDTGSLATISTQDTLANSHEVQGTQEWYEGQNPQEATSNTSGPSTEPRTSCQSDFFHDAMFDDTILLPDLRGDDAFLLGRDCLEESPSFFSVQDVHSASAANGPSSSTRLNASNSRCASENDDSALSRGQSTKF